MLDHPPREREWTSWLLVAVWAVIIFLTIPFARRIQEFVTAQWGRETFTCVVMLVVFAATSGALVRGLRGAQRISRAGMAWLAAVAALTIYFTGQVGAPEEALHFIEYGVLGLFLFRAFGHRLSDPGIYVAAALAGSVIGACDEVVQWMTPRRFFDFRDIRLNVIAVVLMIVAIAKGIRPAYVAGRVSAKAVRWSCRLAAALLLILGLCAANTPARIVRYTALFPRLEFLRATTSQMAEYGYLHEDPEIGSFYSRFSVDGLRRTDAARAEAAAKILDEYHNPGRYEKFLRTYTPGTDPFLHEARVHLYRRDHYLGVAYKSVNRPEMLRYHATVAYRENQLVEKYFGQTLHRSEYVLEPYAVEFLARNADMAAPYRSEVSANLITRWSDRQIGAGILLGLVVLGVVARYYGRE